MKTVRNFLIILVGLALTASFIAQQNVQTESFNQASILSFELEPNTHTDSEPVIHNKIENLELILPGIKIEDKVNPKNVYPVIKVEGEYLPHILLPEVKIVDTINLKNVYPVINVNGEYLPHILLPEVKITAN